MPVGTPSTPTCLEQGLLLDVVANFSGPFQSGMVFGLGVAAADANDPDMTRVEIEVDCGASS